MSSDRSATERNKRLDQRRQGGGGVWVYASFCVSLMILGYTMWGVVRGTFSGNTRPSSSFSDKSPVDAQVRLSSQEEENVRIRRAAYQRQNDLVDRVRQQNEQRKRELKHATEILSFDAQEADRNFDKRKREARKKLDEWLRKNADQPPPPEDSVQGRRIQELELISAGRD